VALGIDGEPQAGLRNRAFLADAGDDVGERAAFGRVVEHVVDGDEGSADARAQLVEPAEPTRLVAAIAVHAGDEGAARRGARERGEPLGERGIMRWRMSLSANRWPLRRDMR
jgi:hypothetical protein